MKAANALLQDPNRKGLKCQRQKRFLTQTTLAVPSLFGTGDGCICRRQDFLVPLGSRRPILFSHLNGWLRYREGLFRKRGLTERS